MDPVVHFEMGYKDAKRVTDFYTSVFGWHMQLLDEKMGNYIVAHTSDTDDATNMVKTSGAINGGFYQNNAIDPDSTTHVVIAVTDIKAALEKVKAHGGFVKSEPMPIPGIGDFAAILDSEGNPVALLQPAPRTQN